MDSAYAVVIGSDCRPYGGVLDLSGDGQRLIYVYTRRIVCLHEKWTNGEHAWRLNEYWSYLETIQMFDD